MLSQPEKASLPDTEQWAGFYKCRGEEGGAVRVEGTRWGCEREEESRDDNKEGRRREKKNSTE